MVDGRQPDRGLPRSCPAEGADPTRPTGEAADVTTSRMTSIADLDRKHAARREALAMQMALDEERARRRSEIRAARWAVAVLAEALKELRLPEPPEPVDPHEIEEYEEHERRLFEAEIEDIMADGGDVAAYIAERQREALKAALSRLHPDHDRKGPQHADAAPLIDDLHARGVSLQSIALTLNALDIPGARHGRWYGTTVRRILARAKHNR